MYHQEDLKSFSAPLKDHKWEANSKCVNSTWQGKPALILPSVSEYRCDSDYSLQSDIKCQNKAFLDEEHMQRKLLHKQQEATA